MADTPGDPRPSSRQILGSWVDLPEPAHPHYHLVGAEQGRYLLAVLADGELRWIDNRRDLGPVALQQGLGFADGLPERDQFPVDGPALLRALRQDTPAAVKDPPVADEASGEFRIRRQSRLV